MSTSAYNLYVNLQAQTAGLTSGLRSGAGQLRQFDGQLQQVNRTLMETSSATQRLARLQASASVDAVLGQTRVTAAAERSQAAQTAAAAAAERNGRAQVLAANLAAKAETERAAAVMAGERALRAQALAQTMAARAQAATGRGALAAQNTAAAAARAAAQAAQAQTLQEGRAAAAQAAAARGAALSNRTLQARQVADRTALTAVAARSEAEAAAAQRAAANAAAVRQAQAAADAESRAATQARNSGYLKTGVVLAAVLGAGVAQAVALEKRMANVMTISRDINSSTVGTFSDQIVDLSKDLTQSSNQLADGLYQIVSTGFDGADAMTILGVAAQGASAGLTTTETSSRALLGVLKAYGLTAGDASDVMDIMFQTVNKGVISFEELAQHLGGVVPMAAAAGVEFDDMSAAIATITLAGIPAAESVTALNMMLTRMMQPTDELSTAIKTLGYDSAASAVQQDGLYVVVNKLVKSTHGQAEAITSLFHDVRASRAVLALAAADGQNYADAYSGIANEVERAGATQRAFQMQMDTTAGQWAMFVNRSKALGMDLGRAMLPVLQSVGEAVSVFAGALADAPGPLKEIGAGMLAVSAGGMLALVVVSKLTTQWREFRVAQAAARAGQSAMPAVLKGAGLAVSGLTALLAVGVIAYSAYSASKQKAKIATDDLVTALRAENEQGDEGAGLRALTESLTKDDDAAKLKAAGIDMADALTAITSGGEKLAALKAKLRSDTLLTLVNPQTKQASTVLTAEGNAAMDVIDTQHDIWSNAVKKQSELAANMDIVNAKVRQARVNASKVWSLELLVPPGKDGVPEYTEEMQAMAKALGGIVDPAKAWAAAQDKVAKSNKNAKATLKDYMDQLQKQLKSQRDFQKNLSALAMSGYTGLTDHFSTLGVDSAPILDELVKQLSKGKTKVADELQGILAESSSRSTEAFRAGLDQLPAIAARYGKKTAQKFAEAAETNDARKFGKVLQEMAVTDMARAVKKGSAAAKVQMQRGMGLLAQVAEAKGADAANALQRALLSGDVTDAMSQLQAIWGADLPISAEDLKGVAGAFKTAGQQSLTEWTGMLTLIQQVAKTKGSEAAMALTGALLSGDMGAVQAQLDAIGASVRQIPGTKTISVNVNPPSPVSVSVIPRIAPGADFPWANKPQPQADGSLLSFYAGGGMRESHVAQIAPAGAWRVWAEPETAGEAYIPLASSKRARSKTILSEVAHRFGASVDFHAEGGLSGWTYQPAGGTDGLFSLSSIASDSMNKKGTAVDWSKFGKNLDKALREAQRWRKDLATVARRAGQDVADALEAMGADGIDLTHKMATGSSKYTKAMAKDLEKLAATAKASLSEYTSQLGGAAKQTSAFQTNLAKLAAQGYGDLAARLAEQGDQAAIDLAAQAVKSKSAASKANSASKAASATLSDQDLADLLSIISAIKSSKTGIHQVADVTELGEDRIIEVANAGLSRLKKALGSRATKFVADLGRANKGLSYAQGGVLTPGLYATSNGLVRFAEPSTGGEAYIPLGQSKRPNATAVLEDVAQRFGYTLTAQGVTGPMRMDARPAGGVQVVVVKEQTGPLIGQMPVTVTSGQGGRGAAQEIGAQVMRRLRAAQRGGKL